MKETHQPREEFVSNLEWQIRTSLSRGNRFSEPVKTQPGGKMKIAVLILASALMGAGGVVVKDEVQDRRAQEVLLRETEVRLRMAELQLEMVRTQEEEIEGLFETGLVDEEALLQAQEQVRHAELELMRVILDREEIRESGERPRNDIPAPLVGSRDFVTERLVLLEAIASDQMSRVERHLARYREMAAVGAIGSDDITNLNLAYQEAEAHLENLHLQLAYRQRFLSGEATGAELEHALQIAEAQNEMNLRQGALDGAVRRLQTLEERAGSGVVAEPEVRRARLEIMRMEMELDLIRLRLDDLLRSTPGDEAVAEGV
jgi:hypothetical protein